jgi:hypothetical protein
MNALISVPYKQYLSNEPAAATLSVVRFLRSASAKNEPQKEDKVPLRKIISVLPRCSGYLKGIGSSILRPVINTVKRLSNYDAVS